MTSVRRIDPAKPNWRSSTAEGLEASAITIDEAIERLAELEHLFVDDPAAQASVRLTRSMLLSRRNQRIDEAGRLRAAAEEMDRG